MYYYLRRVKITTKLNIKLLLLTIYYVTVWCTALCVLIKLFLPADLELLFAQMENKVALACATALQTFFTFNVILNM